MANITDREWQWYKTIQEKRRSYKKTLRRWVYNYLMEEVENAKEQLRKIGEYTSTKKLSYDLYFNIYFRYAGVFAELTYNRFNKSVFRSFTWKLIIKEYLDNQLSWLIDKVDLYTYNTILETVKALGEEHNWDIEAITTHLGNKYINDYEYRIERIARTEMTRASSFGIVKGAEMTGLNLKKRWIAVRDRRTRSIVKDVYGHREADGQTVALNEYFRIPTKAGAFEEVQYPCSPEASAGNCVNCRCVVSIVFDA